MIEGGECDDELNVTDKQLEEEAKSAKHAAQFWNMMYKISCDRETRGWYHGFVAGLILASAVWVCAILIRGAF